MWFILDEPKTGRPPSRKGPYTRDTFVQLLGQERIEKTQLIWTNERIFPNASNPRSSRMVRLSEWRRIEQFPEPTLRKLQAEAQKVMASNNMGKVLPIHGTPAPDGIPKIPKPRDEDDDDDDDEKLKKNDEPDYFKP